jgi:hypothetical protein
MNDGNPIETVEAPAEILWRCLLEVIEAPERFSKEVTGAEVFARVDGTYGRTVMTELGVRTERIDIDNARRELVFEMIEDSPCAGRIVVRVFENPGVPGMLSMLECTIDLAAATKRAAAAISAITDEMRDTIAAVKVVAESVPR